MERPTWQRIFHGKIEQPRIGASADCAIVEDESNEGNRADGGKVDAEGDEAGSIGFRHRFIHTVGQLAERRLHERIEQRGGLKAVRKQRAAGKRSERAPLSALRLSRGLEMA